MLSPDEIETRDFPVTIDGYHRGEVRSFLTSIAQAYGHVVRQVESQDAGASFEHLGAEVAAVLRTAHEAAATLTAQGEERLRTANDEATEVLANAARDADELLGAAESIRVEAVDEAAALRAQASAELEAARRNAEGVRAEAERVLEAARADAGRVEEETERQRTEVQTATQQRLAELASHEATLRDRLWDLNETLRGARSLLASDEVETSAHT